MKIVKIIQLKIVIFTAVEYYNILYGRVLVNATLLRTSLPDAMGRIYVICISDTLVENYWMSLFRNQNFISHPS